jgi:hypothetical protein
MNFLCRGYGQIYVKRLFGLPVGVVVSLLFCLLLHFFMEQRFWREFLVADEVQDIDLAPHRLHNPSSWES